MATTTGGTGRDFIYGASDALFAPAGYVDLVAATETVADNFYGNESDETIEGDEGANDLDGRGGQDIVRGFGGDDRFGIINAAHIVAGDVLDGGTGDDTISVSFSDGLIAIDLSPAELISIERFESEFFLNNLQQPQLTMTAAQASRFESIALERGRLVISDAGDVDLEGASVKVEEIVLSDGGNNLSINLTSAAPFRHTVTGGASADTITVAIVVNDPQDLISITGNGGDDVLTGGGGGNRFHWNSATGSGADTITNFNTSTDRMVFDDLLHGTFAYLGAGAFTNSGNSQARFESGSVNVDTDGNGIFDIEILLTGYVNANQLNASDFSWS